jgi:UPF0716 protein FxsA
MWGLIAFLALPLIEIGLFVEVGGLIGLWPTLGLVLLSAVIGSVVIRAQGALALDRMRASLGDPSGPMARGALGFLAGLLMIIPGLLTSALGILLLVPVVQDLVLRRMSARMTVRSFGGGQDQPRPTVIDAEYHEVTPESRNKRPPSGWTEH